MSPECPVCGINLLYYNMEETLSKEADKAEYQHAKFQPKLDRLKSGNIGSPLAVARLVIMFLPLLVVLVPFGKVSVTFPFYHKEVTLQIISLINNFFNDFDFNYYLSMAKAPGELGGIFTVLLASLLCYALALVFMLINLINQFMIVAKKGIARSLTIAFLGLASEIGFLVCFWICCNKLGAFVPDVFSGSFVLGGVCYPLSFLLEIIINFVYKKHGPPVKYTDVSQLLIPYEQRDHSKEKIQDVVISNKE